MDKPTDKDLELFFEIHSGMPREGPGDKESTAKAFSLLTELPANPRVLDIGCGPGKQTIDLARLTDGEIVAVDNHVPYLDVLKRKVMDRGLEERIRVEFGDMFNLGYEARSFDLIWAEGSIYIFGFARGLQSWKRLLKKGGYLAATELTWLKPDPPGELTKYWQVEYPPMTTTEKNLEVIGGCGYEVVGHFALPESAWWDDYYDPQEKRLSLLREKYRNDDEALTLFAAEQKEIDIYRRYSDFYGYVFYVCRSA